MENLTIFFENTLIQYLLFISTILISVSSFGSKKIFMSIKLLLLISLICYFITYTKPIIFIICIVVTTIGLTVRFVLDTIKIMDESSSYQK
jgi:hypothetical protein